MLENNFEVTLDIHVPVLSNERRFDRKNGEICGFSPFKYIEYFTERPYTAFETCFMIASPIKNEIKTAH